MIKIYWKAIKRDVDRETWKIGKVLIDDTAPDKRYEVQTDDSPTSIRLVLRWAEEGIALCNVLLKEREQAAKPSDSTTTTDTETEYNDKLVTTDLDTYCWTVEATNSKFKTDERSLAILIHQFVVAYILWRWSQMFFPGNARQWQESMTIAQTSLEEEAFSLSVPRKWRKATQSVSVVEIS